MQNLKLATVLKINSLQVTGGRSKLLTKIYLK